MADNEKTKPTRARDGASQDAASETPSETVPVPENPTRAELSASLEEAEFPRASHMAKEIFGENPRLDEEEE
ncbi:hypothetical protein [uncultured Algimonas sp.]|uniref:hypothetical protein n=1 Tax=uncultured Algimonas sp. TaxID=1547920 RepID=UPI00260F7608|nr:hypothetical protein [uncultured Algimonas sp.]